jgi:hypothetical protein
LAVTRHSDAVAPIRSSGPVTIWFSRHVSTAAGSLTRLLRQPFASLMIILVIAVTLAIPAAGILRGSSTNVPTSIRCG